MISSILLICALVASFTLGRWLLQVNSNTNTNPWAWEAEKAKSPPIPYQVYCTLVTLVSAVVTLKVAEINGETLELGLPQAAALAVAALLGSLLPFLTRWLSSPLEVAWKQWRLDAPQRSVRRRHFKLKRREAAQQLREARAKKKERKRQNDTLRLERLAYKGYKRIREVGERDRVFWAELLAYVGVMLPYNESRPSSEITRLRNWIRAIDHDLKRIPPEVKETIGSGFQSNKANMRIQLEGLREQGMKLLRLAAAMLDDTDDDMLVIERDIATGRTHAEEQRDKLIADYRTLLDHVELLIGASPRRQRSELIARSDEEVAKLTTGELRAVQADGEIDELMLRRFGHESLPTGGESPEEARTRSIQTHLSRQRS